MPFMLFTVFFLSTTTVPSEGKHRYSFTRRGYYANINFHILIIPFVRNKTKPTHYNYGIGPQRIIHMVGLSIQPTV